MDSLKDKEFYLNHGNRISDEQGHIRRREEFLKYLEETGLVNKVTGVLLDLYENPVVDYPTTQYLRMNLVDVNPDVENIKIVEKELRKNKLLRNRLRKEMKNLEAKLKKIKNDRLADS